MASDKPPQWAVDAARRVWVGMMTPSELIRAIARALAAERERAGRELDDLRQKNDELRTSHESRRARVSLAISQLRETFRLRPGCDNIGDAVEDACAALQVVASEPHPLAELTKAEADAVEPLTEQAIQAAVERGSRERRGEPVCSTCNDTHQTKGVAEDGGIVDIPCTHCPVSCPKCEDKFSFARWCKTTPCPCECHVKKPEPRKCTRCGRSECYSSPPPCGEQLPAGPLLQCTYDEPQSAKPEELVVTVAREDIGLVARAEGFPPMYGQTMREVLLEFGHGFEQQRDGLRAPGLVHPSARPTLGLINALEPATPEPRSEPDGLSGRWHQVGDGAFAPPFGTIRQCHGCGCLVGGGPTACVRCVNDPALAKEVR